MSKPKIYCFINSASPEWYEVVALSEDGDCITSHVSSSPGWAIHDIGINSDWKHDLYRAKYPDGYELEWIERDAVKAHEGLSKACELNQEKMRSTTPEPTVE